MVDKNRRGLFKKALNPLMKEEKEVEEKLLIRPPYNLDPSLFHNECPECEDKPCVASCGEEIIKVAEDGSVYLDFSKSGCEFCDDCAKACERGVLSLENPSKIFAVAEINVISCMAWHQTICYSCKDVCLDDAITFTGLFNPEVDFDKCTGCGFCYGVCPTRAITMKERGEI